MSMISSHIFHQIHDKPESDRAVSGPASFARALQLPPDCKRGCPLVSVMGRERICIENFKGICSYTPESVRLTTADGRICVSGKCLQINCYTKDEIEISGRIRSIVYE